MAEGALETTEQPLPDLGCSQCGAPFSFAIERRQVCIYGSTDEDREADEKCRARAEAYETFFGSLEAAWQLKLYPPHRREILSILRDLRQAEVLSRHEPQRRGRGRPASPLDIALTRLISLYGRAREDRNKAANVLRRADDQPLLPFAPTVPIKLTVKNDIGVGKKALQPLEAGLLFLRSYMPRSTLPAPRVSEGEVVYDANGLPNPVNFMRLARAAYRGETSAIRTRAGRRGEKKRFLRLRNVSGCLLQGFAPQESFLVAVDLSVRLGGGWQDERVRSLLPGMELLPVDLYWRKRLADGSVIAEEIVRIKNGRRPRIET